MVASPRATARAYEGPPFVDAPDVPTLGKYVQDGFRDAYNGKTNAVGSVTLTQNATTTTVTDLRCGPNSVILFMPTTLNAAGEVGWYVSARTDDSFTITHAYDARTDRTFAYLIMGP